MRNYKISVIVGSLRRDSINRRLATAVERLAPSDFSFQALPINDLPLYNQDLDSAPSEPVTRMKQELQASHGCLFVTPEYNRSIPGVLKNAIDHASRPCGKSAWSGKPAGILSASMGAIGGALAQQHLRNITAYLDMATLDSPKRSCEYRTVSLTRTATFPTMIQSRSFKDGWTDTSCGWSGTAAETSPDEIRYGACGRWGVRSARGAIRVTRSLRSRSSSRHQQ